MSSRIPALAEGSASVPILKKSTTPAKELQERQSIGSRKVKMRLGAIVLAIVGIVLAPSGASPIETYSSSASHQTIAKAVVPDGDNEPLYC